MHVSSISFLDHLGQPPQKIAQGEILPSFCAADPQKKPLFFYPNFGCHLISCCTVDQDAQQQETSDANKELNLNILFTHTTSHNPYSQEVEHFVQKLFKSSKNNEWLKKLTFYVARYYDTSAYNTSWEKNFSDWQANIVHKNALIASKENSPLEQQNARNLVEIIESILAPIIQELGQVMPRMAEIALSSADRDTVLNGFALLIHENFGNLIAPHINNNQLDLFISLICDGIYQGILRESDR